MEKVRLLVDTLMQVESTGQVLEGDGLDMMGWETLKLKKGEVLEVLSKKLDVWSLKTSTGLEVRTSKKRLQLL